MKSFDLRLGLESRYIGFIETFNQGRYFEAHEVLEPLWLDERKAPNDSFYKGLIQLAGAFVLLQKGRTPPATALFKLARENLQKYPVGYLDLDTLSTLSLIEAWLARLEAGLFESKLLEGAAAPQIRLLL